MTRRLVLINALPLAALAVVWVLLTPHSRLVFERWSVAITATVLTVAYIGFAAAFFLARKTRLNAAAAHNKFDLFLFFGLLSLPVLWGLVWHDAPFRANPYALWVVPPFVRCWLFWRVSISSVGQAYEFWRANWGPRSTFPDVDRRRIPFGRRFTDRPAEALRGLDD